MQHVSDIPTEPAQDLLVFIILLVLHFALPAMCAAHMLVLYAVRGVLLTCLFSMGAAAHRLVLYGGMLFTGLFSVL